MKYPSVFIRFGFFPGVDNDLPQGVADYTIRIGKYKATFVVRSRFKVEDAARELVGCRIVPPLFMTVDLLAADAQQWMTGAPFAFALLAVVHSHGGVPVIVARNNPLKTRAHKGRGLYHEMIRTRFIPRRDNLCHTRCEPHHKPNNGDEDMRSHDDTICHRRIAR